YALNLIPDRRYFDGFTPTEEMEGEEQVSDYPERLTDAIEYGEEDSQPYSTQTPRVRGGEESGPGDNLDQQQRHVAGHREGNHQEKAGHQETECAPPGPPDHIT